MMMKEKIMHKTLYQKIIDTHTVKIIDNNTVLLYCDIHFANEYTSPQAFAGLVQRNIKVLSPDSHLCVVDHIIPTRDEFPRKIYDEASLLQAQTLEKNCKHFDISAFYGANSSLQGIEHIVMQEQGLVRPGMVVICGDSHTTTHGAIGALGFGIGTSEIEHILATQTLVYRMAGTMRITINGSLTGNATAKDLALAVLRKISARGALGLVVEYTGEAVSALSVEDRMVLCNMTVESGARGAIVAPDEKSLQWVFDHAQKISETDRQSMKEYVKVLHSDPEASFDKEVSLNASSVRPMVTWGTSPDQAISFDEKIPTPESFQNTIAIDAAKRALEYQKLKAGDDIYKTPIQHVFIGSCTNSRLCDLQAAAQILKGRRVAAGVHAQVVPGSMKIRKQAEELGLDTIFRDAGFEWRKSGCSLCLAMNDDVLQPGVRCASTTNRNFEGRQGRGSLTHLVSPETAAASAIMGYLCSKNELE